MLSWYVIHTHPREETRALHHLRRQGFEVYLPQYLKRRRHARRTTWAPAPLFPRYLFVLMDVSAQRWRAVNSTVGVAYLVSANDRPTPMPRGVVEEIMARTDDDGMVGVSWRRLEKGAPVQIMRGALADHVGFFECADDQARVFILLELLGRQVKVRVPAEDVCALT